MVEFTAKCIQCGQRFEMTRDMELQAARDGCAISPCCNFPSTIERVTVKRKPPKRKERA